MPGAESARQIFDEFDTDGSGHIDATELQKALQKAGVAASSTDVSSIVQRIDTDGDGKISYPEFAAFVAANEHLKENFTAADVAITMKSSFLTSPEDIAIHMGSAIRTQSQAGQGSKVGLMICIALGFCVMLFGFMGVQIWTAIVGGKYVDSSTQECKKSGQFLVSYVAIALGVGVLCGLCRPFLVQAGGGADPDENSLLKGAKNLQNAVNCAMFGFFIYGCTLLQGVQSSCPNDLYTAQLTLILVGTVGGCVILIIAFCFIMALQKLQQR